ncbi:MAG: PilZ domain-containing protein [Phycisphaerae bacterium]
MSTAGQTLVSAVPSGASARSGNSNRARRAREPRWAHRAPCCVRIADPASRRFAAVLGTTVNLSRSGVAVLIDRPVGDGAAVEVTLTGRAGEPIQVAGIVAHCRQVLIGTFEIGVRCGETREAASG